MILNVKNPRIKNPRFVIDNIATPRSLRRRFRSTRGGLQPVAAAFDTYHKKNIIEPSSHIIFTGVVPHIMCGR